MGSIRGGEDSAGEDTNSTTESARHADDVDDDEDDAACPRSGERWPLGAGTDYWQATAKGVRERVASLHNSREMSDVSVLASDENWWFGDTVKDFTAHKLLLGTVSPVLHKLLFELDETANPARRLLLDPRLRVTLALTQCYDYVRVDVDGVPPIAMEALLDYIYRDRFDEQDFANGYSRNLLWRLWHASKALEMHHLEQLCTQTIHQTMCEETVFWDLNYAISYKDLESSDVLSKVLLMIDDLNEKVYEHDNFVWLERAAVDEILRRRSPANCDALIIYNNLLRWALFQVDRSACAEIDDKTGSDIPVRHRLDWIVAVRAGTLASVDPADLEKYLRRALRNMPWTELSQKDFLESVAPFAVLSDDELLRQALAVMDVVVRNPARLHKSAFHAAVERCVRSSLNAAASNSKVSSPSTPKKNLSRKNSLHAAMTEVKLRKTKRPESFVAA